HKAPAAYGKIHGACRFQDVLRRRRIRKPRHHFITKGSKFDSESDDDSTWSQPNAFPLTTSTTKNADSQKPPKWTTDPDFLYLTSEYIQLAFNMFLVGVALFLGLEFIQTIRRNVDQKVVEYSNGNTHY